MALLPVTRWEQLFAEARASLLYVQNVELISSQLAYEAAGPDSSPFQHFWSLSVQGQFFLVWPLVAVIAVMVANRTRLSAASAMFALTGAVLVTSFVFSIYMGYAHQEAAYLMTRTRFWELAFGGILALVISGLNLPRMWRDTAGWAGLALVVSSGFVLDGANVFPGPWALWPLLGMALVLLSADAEAGDHARWGTVAHLLSTLRLAGWERWHTACTCGTGRC
ncbi:acyltransferase [Nesterenkonia pannonica]|uniref:acyltransferase family protein n=1 Tax=Nesterenkonia pannonica TaxID=1548602 RepID=UPI00216482F5|nr:acyltransferase [Nesterenkonia pannonica]